MSSFFFFNRTNFFYNLKKITSKLLQSMLIFWKLFFFFVAFFWFNYFIWFTKLKPNRIIIKAKIFSLIFHIWMYKSKYNNNLNIEFSRLTERANERYMFSSDPLKVNWFYWAIVPESCTFCLVQVKIET